MNFLKYAIGIDMGMEKLDACISLMTVQQQVIVKAQCNFNNDYKGFALFHAWVIKNIKMDLPIIFLMEATGVYYEQLAWFLYDKGCTVSVVLPNKAKKYKEALGLKSKNDHIDAKGLAQMACEQKATQWKPFSKDIYLLRLITRQIQNISKQCNIISNQLHALQHAMFRDKVIEKMYNKQLTLLQKNKKDLQKRIELIVYSDKVLKQKFQNICKIKGLGLQNLAVIVAETNGFAAFENIAQLVSYAGYDVIENQSGKRTGKTKISKKGNAHIRKCLHFPAFNTVRLKVGPFKNLYERVYERSKIKMKAYTAVQKKLLVMVFVLWKNDQSFNPDYQDKVSRDAEPESSLASASKGINPIVKKVALAKTKATQDRHPSKHRRMPSLAYLKIT
jgi:transposase